MAGQLLDTTLCYIECAGRYLMLNRNKKRNDISEGKWIGVGGKFEPGETAAECLVREVREETGFDLRAYDYRGVVHFVNDVYVSEEMYLFTAQVTAREWILAMDEATGVNVTIGSATALAAPESEPTQADLPVPECDEGTFAWIPIDEVDTLNLWPGDRVFLEELARGERGIDLTLVYHGDELVATRERGSSCGTS